MEKHTPLIRLDAARNAWRAAQQACPHWDYECGGTGRHSSEECCRNLDEAEREYHLAHAAYRKGA